MAIYTKSNLLLLALLTLELMTLYCQVTANPISTEFRENSTISLDDDAFHDLIDFGIDLVDTGYYEEAFEAFRKLMLYYPESPVGYYYTASLYQIIMRDYRVKTFEPQFERFINLAVKKGECAVRKNRDDAISYLYLGNVYGHKAIHNIRQHKWFSAFKDSLKSISCWEKALVAEPTLYDTYCSLGMYHYWRSAKSRSFWFLPLIRDERQRGINELWQSIRKGKHSEINGKYALTYIYYNEANYEKAWEINQELYELFPKNPSCLYMRGRILEQQRKWEEATDAFRQLLDCLMASGYRSTGYQIECHYRMALYLSKQKQFCQALEKCEFALQLSKLRNPSEELEGPLESTKEVLNDAQKLYRELSENYILK